MRCNLMLKNGNMEILIDLKIYNIDDI